MEGSGMKGIKIVQLTQGEKYQRLLGGDPETFGMKSGNVILRPGEEVGEHSTDRQEEAILILKGEAQFFAENREPIRALKGSLLYVPPDTKHNVKNTGKEDLQYVYVVAPIA